MQCRLTRDYEFEAAHSLPRVPDDHKCRRMHGHSYRIKVILSAPIDAATGWVMDFADVDRVVAPVIAAIDHRVLNEIEGLDNPTSENLAVWVWRKLEGALPLFEVEVAETRDSRCAVRGDA